MGIHEPINSVDTTPSLSDVPLLLKTYLDRLRERLSVWTFENYLPVQADFSSYDPQRTTRKVTDTEKFWASLPNAPYLCFVVGEYGIGKTFMLLNAAVAKEAVTQRHRIPKLLPAQLSHFPPRDTDSDIGRNIERGILNELNIRASSGQTGPMWSQMLKMIRSSEIVLALDGLDEYIKPQEFGHFVKSLFEIIVNGTGDYSRSRVIVSVRSEFLRLAGNYGTIPLGQFLSTHFQTIANPPKICQLELRGFRAKEVRDYLRRKPNSIPIEEQSYFSVEQLTRPVMAWIYSEIDKSATCRHELNTRTNIVEAYVEQAVKTANIDTTLWADMPKLKEYLGDEHTITRHAIWDIDQLAVLAKKRYEETAGLGNSFTPTDVENCLAHDVVGALSNSNLTADAASKIRTYLTHKCTFLFHRPNPESYEPKELIEFSHRIYYEYFTALAVWNEVEQANDRTELKDRFTTFDDLVLNVDTRKFLRDLAGKHWFDRTRRAYALDMENHEWSHPNFGRASAEEWNEIKRDCVPSGQELKLMDHNRCLILAMMTYPRSEDDGLLREELKLISDTFHPDRPFDPKKEPYDHILEAIDLFLEETVRQKWMHPRYLIPNLEPIWEYLSQVSNRISNDDDSVVDRKRFAERYRQFVQVLEKCYKKSKDYYFLLGRSDLLIGRGDIGSRLWAGYGLLVERCLSIGMRLRLPWVQHEIHFEHTTILQLIQKGDKDLVKKRILQICENIPRDPRWQDPWF